MNPLAVGTEMHLSYQHAFQREQWKARIYTVLLFTLTGIGVWFASDGWDVVISVLFVIGFLLILNHYSISAVRHRAYHYSDKEKPLLP